MIRKFRNLLLFVLVISSTLFLVVNLTFALPQELLRDNARSNNNNRYPSSLSSNRDGTVDGGGGGVSSSSSTASKRIRVQLGDSASLECNIAGLERRYEAERARARSQAGNDDGERASLQRLVQWHRVPPGDQSGRAQQVKPEDDFNFIVTPKYSGGGGSSQLPSQSMLTIYNINRDGKYTGMYWCNYTDDSGQNVMQVFTVELDNMDHQHSQPNTNVYNSYPAEDHNHSHQHDHENHDMHDDDDDEGGAEDFYCYQCLPSALNQYCTQVDARTARVACPASRRCLSMWATCEGIQEPLPFAVCDPIEYEGWTEMVLQEPLVLENGKCAVVSDEMEANILNDVAVGREVREPFSHIQNAVRPTAENIKDMRTYHYDTCRLQQITLCRCDSPGCNMKPEYLVMSSNATTTDGTNNKDQRLMDAQGAAAVNKAASQQQRVRQQPNSATTTKTAAATLHATIIASVLAFLLL